jgi:hypothetical protein
MAALYLELHLTVFCRVASRRWFPDWQSFHKRIYVQNKARSEQTNN